MYLCIYVSMDLLIYVSMYLCMYVSKYVCLFVCLYVCLFVCLYVCACMHACMHAHTDGQTHGRTYVRTYVRPYVACSYVPMYVCTYVRMHTARGPMEICRVWMNLDMYIYIYSIYYNGSIMYILAPLTTQRVKLHCHPTPQHQMRQLPQTTVKSVLSNMLHLRMISRESQHHRMIRPGISKWHCKMMFFQHSWNSRLCDVIHICVLYVSIK